MVGELWRYRDQVIEKLISALRQISIGKCGCTNMWNLTFWSVQITLLTLLSSIVDLLKLDPKRSLSAKVCLNLMSYAQSTSEQRESSFVRGTGYSKAERDAELDQLLDVFKVKSESELMTKVNQAYESMKRRASQQLNQSKN